jgi:hypothetical protein
VFDQLIIYKNNNTGKNTAAVSFYYFELRTGVVFVIIPKLAFTDKFITIPFVYV